MSSFETNQLSHPDLNPETNTYIDAIFQEVKLLKIKLEQARDIDEKIQLAEKIQGKLELIQKSKEAKKPIKEGEVDISQQIEQAREIMGKEFFGPEEIEKAFGIKIKAEDIPKIPFKKEDLERAKELNQFLILRVDKAPDGKPLSLQKMNDLLSDEFEKDGHGKIFYDTDWYKNEDFFTKEAPKLSWALVSKEVIPNSTEKNYLQQTEELVKYLKTQVFKGEEVPEEYQEAIQEFEDYVKSNFSDKTKEEIIQLLKGSDWKKYAQELSELKINQISRQSPAEFIYDILAYFKNNEERLFENRYIWTRRRVSDGELVSVGAFASDGANVNGSTPGHSYDYLGVSFSRSSAVGG